nr:invasion associated locus B family protein [uncultured Cohaesibacter sp.]
MATVTTATYGNWVLRCVSPQSTDGKTAKMCEIIQTVQVKGKPVAQVAIGRRPKETDLTLTAVLPVNIAIPGNVVLADIAEAKATPVPFLKLNWTQCLQVGCYADAKLDATSLQKIRAGTAAALIFDDAARRHAEVPLSWLGADMALVALDKEK